MSLLADSLNFGVIKKTKEGSSTGCCLFNLKIKYRAEQENDMGLAVETEGK